jgi:hypothetical protein
MVDGDQAQGRQVDGGRTQGRWAGSGQAWEVAAVAVRCQRSRWQFELSGRAGSGSVSVRST